MHHEAAHRFYMDDVAEAPHPTLLRVETHATIRSIDILTASATNRTASPSLSTIVMMVDERLRHKSARQFSMGDAAEAPHQTLPRAETHATKISVEILTAKISTNITASPSLPTIVMMEMNNSDTKRPVDLHSAM